MADGPEGVSTALQLEFIRADINVFDLYRRVGRLEEARILGEQTFAQTLSFEDAEVTHRAGNFLTLVHSAEAYQLIGEGKLTEALAVYRVIGSTFGQMGIEQADGKSAVMLYLNQAANYLNIADLARDMDASADISSELKEADASIEGAQYHMPVLDHQDRLVWMANLYANLAQIDMHQQDYVAAVFNFMTASIISSQTDYSIQTAILDLSLAEAMVHNSPEHRDEVVRLMGNVDAYLEEHDFGVYQHKAEKMLTTIRQNLEE